MSVAWHRAHAVKRGGRCQFISLDAESGEQRYRLEPVYDLSAEKVFDARWAETLMARATSRLRDDYVNAGRERIFARLRMFLLEANYEDSNSYRHIAQEFGLSVAGVKTLIFRMRKRFSAILREEVADTLLDPADVDSELHALCDALLMMERHRVD